jgi:hypothetical protein
MIRFKQFVKLTPEEREALKKKPSATGKKTVPKKNNEIASYKKTTVSLSEKKKQVPPLLP